MFGFWLRTRLYMKYPRVLELHSGAGVVGGSRTKLRRGVAEEVAQSKSAKELLTVSM